MNQSRFEVSLRIFHPSMDLRLPCKTLGLTPKHIWKSGEQRKTPKGGKLEGVRESSYCSCALPPVEDYPLLESLKIYTQSLDQHRKLLKQIRETGGTIEYFIGWYIPGNTGETFDIDLLLSLANLGIELSLDLYCDNS